MSWTIDNAKIDWHRFIEDMYKAFFQCTPATWSAFHDTRNNGELIGFRVALISSLLRMHFYLSICSLSRSLHTLYDKNITVFRCAFDDIIYLQDVVCPT